VRPLQMRGTSGTQWIVEGGLHDGDRVIVAGVQKVQPGALVQAVESQTAIAAATPSAALKTAAAVGVAPQPPPASQAK